MYIQSRKQVEHITQTITLVGLGSPTFERAIAAAQEIFGIFDREFEDGQLDVSDIVKHNKEFGTNIELSN